ncbi:MAG TPA: CDP-alcohol phosphatidyltransferase family protein [Anaerolineae bacterium]|nr:CDP-alcohol phosphatidyltransferase family protein [Anaerolineae bacterium]
MIRAKTIADTLTIARVFLALLILWLGVTGGSEALPAAMTALIFAWATDLLDGPLARRDPSAPQTWVGERDLYADVSVGLSVLGYLTFAGFIRLWAGIAYLAICVALLLQFRSVHLGWLVQAPPYLMMFVLALRQAPLQGGIAVAWMLLGVILTWPRFPKETIPAFLRGMRALGRPADQDR